MAALAVCVLAGSGFDCQAQAPRATLNIDVHKVAGNVSPTLYGLMTEEINFSYDGGLYAELVRNRAFQEGRSNPKYWYLVQDGNSRASIERDATTAPSAALNSSLRLKIENADAENEAGIRNDGYWGFPLRPKTHYRGSFYAKVADPALGPVSVCLVDDATGKPVVATVIPSLSPEWKQYKFALDISSDVHPTTASHLVITFRKPGTAWFSLVSLFPPTYGNRENGDRIDLMEKLAKLKPTFLRFPGGNYLEGDTIATRFDWKKTLGPLVDRPTHYGPWRYQSSDGMGMLEFLLWCEDLKMQPVLGIYAGYSLKQEHVDPGKDLEPYVQDALDEIEYVTGGTDTKWGARRAQDGHPKPFPLTYVEVGNEDQFDKSNTYDARFAQFYKAIKAAYPNLQLIATVPVHGTTPDVIDEHYYLSPAEFFANAHHYDQANRSGPKIFIGEWGTHEGSPTPDFSAAMGDAAWMTGLERNSDLVVLASYAPLLVNVSPLGQQWEPDLIGYDGLSSFGSPSYYAQTMFYSHLGNQIPTSTVRGGGPRFFESATYSSTTGQLFLKFVNASSDTQPVAVQIDGVGNVKSAGTLIRLSARSPFETNTITAPVHLVPMQTTLMHLGKTFEHSMPPYSIEVIELSTESRSGRHS
jgi:alpha-N-arabinofuranosidase